MIYCHIVATSQNHVIGLQGKMPWHLPADLKHFKTITAGHIVIMGRKTFESIGKALPQRFNIVISRNSMTSPPEENLQFVTSLQEAQELSQKLVPQWGTTAFIIGGGEIYQQTLPLVERVYLTLIHQHLEGDTTYPLLPKNEFALVEKVDHQGDPSYSFLRFDRIHSA